MIEASARWRFVAAVTATNYYEEDIVQHLHVERQAIRRALTKKTMADPVAVRVISDQARLAARSTGGSAPIVYHSEEISGRLTFLFELIEGRGLPDLINQNVFHQPASWAAAAESIAGAMLELRDAGGRFDRLTINDVVFSELGEARFIRLAPVGVCSDADAAASAIVARLLRSEQQGIYFAEGDPKEADDVKALLHLIARMAMGPGRNNVDAFMRDLSSEETRCDPRIKEILVALEADRMGRSTCGSLEEAHRMLASLRVQLLQQKLRDDPRERSRSGETGGSQAIPAEASASKPAFAAPKPISPTAPPPPPKLQVAVDDANPYAASAEIPIAQVKAFETPGKRPTSQLLRDVPKPAAPIAKATPIPKDDGSNPFQLPKSPMEIVPRGLPVSRAEVRRQLNLGLLGKVLAVILIVFLLVGGFVAALMVFAPTPIPPNERPVLVLAPVQGGPFGINQPIPVDLSGSSDPDGDDLNFTLRLVDPPTGEMVFIEEGRTTLHRPPLRTGQVPRFEIRIFAPGRYTFEVSVDDGLLFSESQRFTVEVTGP